MAIINRWTVTGLAVGIAITWVIILVLPAVRAPCRGGTPSLAAVLGSVGVPLPTDDIKNHPDLIVQYAEHRWLGYNAARPNEGDRILEVPLRNADGSLNGRYRRGPRGEIFAERCSYRNDRKALEEGRVIARVRTGVQASSDWPLPGADSGYHKEHYHIQDNTTHVHKYLPPGESFIWVDSLELDQQDSTKGRARAIIVDRRTKQVVATTEVTFEGHPNDPEHNRAYGRWNQDPNDDHLWETCSMYGCCTVGDEAY